MNIYRVVGAETAARNPQATLSRYVRKTRLDGETQYPVGAEDTRFWLPKRGRNCKTAALRFCQRRERNTRELRRSYDTP